MTLLEKKPAVFIIIRAGYIKVHFPGDGPVNHHGIEKILFGIEEIPLLLPLNNFLYPTSKESVPQSFPVAYNIEPDKSPDRKLDRLNLFRKLKLRIPFDYFWENLLLFSG